MTSQPGTLLVNSINPFSNNSDHISKYSPLEHDIHDVRGCVLCAGIWLVKAF